MHDKLIKWMDTFGAELRQRKLEAHIRHVEVFLQSALAELGRVEATTARSEHANLRMDIRATLVGLQRYRHKLGLLAENRLRDELRKALRGA